MNARWKGAWAQALDELEMDVAAAEALLADDHRAREMPRPDPWRPPEGLGPLPLDLRPRADAILARQLAAAEALAVAMTAHRKQAALIGRIQAGEPAPRPVYVDCSM